MARLVLEADATRIRQVLSAVQSELRRTGIEGTVTQRRLRSALDPGDAGRVHRHTSAIRELSNQVRVVGVAADRTHPPVARLHREFERGPGLVSKLTTQFGGLRSILATLGVTLGGFSIKRLAEDVGEAFLTMDRSRRAFAAGAGDVLRGGQEIEFVREEAHRLGISLDSTLKSYGKFMTAMSVSGSTTAETRDIFRSVAQASTVMGLSAEDTRLVFLALEQMVSKGRVSMEELRRQLGEKIPGSMQLAARAMGMPMGEFFDMVETGQLMTMDLLPKMAEEWNKVFGPQLAAAMEAPQAQFGRLANAVFELKVMAGEQAVPAVAALATELYALAQSDEAEDLVRSTAEAVRDLVDATREGVGGGEGGTATREGVGGGEGGTAGMLGDLIELYRDASRELNLLFQTQAQQSPAVDVPAMWEDLVVAAERSRDAHEAAGRRIGEAVRSMADEVRDALAPVAGFFDRVLGDVDERVSDWAGRTKANADEAGRGLAEAIFEGFTRFNLGYRIFEWLSTYASIDREFLESLADSARLSTRAAEDLKRLRKLDITVIDPDSVEVLKGLPTSIEQTVAALEAAGKGDKAAALRNLFKEIDDAAGDLAKKHAKLIKGWEEEAAVQEFLASKIGETEAARARAERTVQVWLALQRAEVTIQTELGQRIADLILKREVNKRLLENEKSLLKNRNTEAKNAAAADRQQADALDAVIAARHELLGLPPIDVFTGVEDLQDQFSRFTVWLERERAEIAKMPIELRFEPTYEDYLADLRERWESTIIDMDEIWRGFTEGVQDALVDFVAGGLRTIIDLFDGGVDSIEDLFRDLWRSVVDMAIQAAAEAAAAWAAQKFATGGGGGGGGGLDFGSIASMFGGGGGSALETGIYGPTQSGGNIAGGGGGGWSTAGAWALAAVAVAAILYSEGVIGAKGKDAVGGVSFGGENLEVLGTFANRRDNIKPVMEKVKAAIKGIREFMEQVDLEIERFGEVTVQKKHKNYQIEAHGAISAGLGAIATAGMTAEEISDAIATLAIRTAVFGDSVSEFVEAVIRGSKAIATEQLAAQIELARMVEDFGKTDFERAVVTIARDMQAVFDQLVELLAGNVEQLSVGLDMTVAEEARRWEERYRELTGAQPSAEELRAVQERERELFNAEKALRIADLEARAAALEVQGELTHGRIELDRVELQTRADVMGAELDMMGRFHAAAGTILGASSEVLNAQLAAIRKLIDALKAIPDVALGDLAPIGGGGGGRRRQRQEDRERLADILDTFDLSLLSDVAQAVAAISAEYEEQQRLAHGDADLLARANAMYERRLELLREELRAEVEPHLPGLTFVGPGGEVGGFGDWGRRAEEIARWAETIAAENEVLIQETGTAALETWEIVAAEANRMRELVGEAIGSLGLTLEGTRERFGALGKTMRFLDAQVVAGAISAERYADVLAQVAQEQFLALGGALVGFLDRYYADVAGFEDFRRNLERVRFEMELANLRLQFELLQGLKLLSEETIAAVAEIFDFIDKNPIDWPNFPVGPGGGSGPSAPSSPVANNAQAERDRALEILQGFLDLELSPYERDLADLTRTFDELRAVLGNTPDVIRAWTLAFDDLNERYTASLRDFLETLRDPALTSGEEYDVVLGRFLALAQTGDLGDSDELLALAQQLRDLGGQVMGTAGGGFQDLLDLIEYWITQFLGEAGASPATMAASTLGIPAVGSGGGPLGIVPSAPGVPPGGQGSAAAGYQATAIVAAVDRGTTILTRLEQIAAAVERNTRETAEQARGLRTDRTQGHTPASAQRASMGFRAASGGRP